MVIRESKKSIVYFIPECTCNKRIKRVTRRASRFDNVACDKEMQWSKDHEELHELSKAIVNFIADTGKMSKQDIMEGMPEYNEQQLSIAANMSMNPIIFPKRRHAPPSRFVQLKEQARLYTEEYIKAKALGIEEQQEELLEAIESITFDKIEETIGSQ
jgi:hypothetical protein